MYALIVEPQARRAALYVGAASDEGLDAVLVASNDEARAVLRERGAPALVLVELTNANVDGFRLLVELREAFVDTRVPAVVVSAFGALRDTAWSLRQSLHIEAVLGSDLPEAGVRLAVRRALGRATAGPDLPPDNRPDPHRERVRLARLREMGLADSSTPIEALERVVAAVASSFDVEAALCSVLTADRELIIAHAGVTGRLLMERGTPREHSIARHVVEAVGGEALVIDDARTHPTFSSNPLVREGIVRGFAGVPLTGRGGMTIGALCVIDTRPLSLSLDAVAALQQLARRVSGELQVHAARQPTTTLHDDAVYALHHFTAMLAHLDQPVALFGPDGILRVANPALAALLSVSSDRLIGMDRPAFAAAVRSVSLDPSFAQMIARLTTEPVVAHEEVHLGNPEDRVLRWSTKPVPLPEGEGQLDVWLDITAERELERAALTDPLTGLANRRAADETLRREVSRCKRIGQPLSFLLIDVDRFKSVNDRHGHGTGDRVLRGVAKVASRQLRASDLAVRWGGEEFLIILPGADLDTAQTIAERIRAAVHSTVFDAVGEVTVSIGSAQLDKSFDPMAALAMADARLYEAKASGRNLVR